MQFKLLTLFTALFSVVAADSALVTMRCQWIGTWKACEWNGLWSTNTAQYKVDAKGGCHKNPGPPSIYEICWDWSNKRAHFKATGQNKRCLVVVKEVNYACTPTPGGTSAQCTNYNFIELSCSWRQATTGEGELDAGASTGKTGKREIEGRMVGEEFTA